MNAKLMHGAVFALVLTGAARADDAAPAVSANAPAPSPTGALPALDYRYDASWGGIPVGQVEVSLKPDGAANCYRYTTVSKPVGFVKALYGAPNQTSQFCVTDGKLRSQRFESVLPGDDEQSYTLSFDWKKHTVTDENGGVRAIPDDAIDSFALQQAVRLWVLAHVNDAEPPIAEFTMVDRKNFTHYQFRLSQHVHVDTPAGPFDTVELERIDNPKKEGRFWLASARDYMPVAIETKNGGKPTVRMVLAK